MTSRRRKHQQQQRPFISVTRLVFVIHIATRTRRFNSANAQILSDPKKCHHSFLLNHYPNILPSFSSTLCCNHRHIDYQYCVRGDEIIDEEEDEDGEENNDDMDRRCENDNTKFEKQRLRVRSWYHLDIPYIVSRGGDNREDTAFSGFYNRLNDKHWRNNNNNNKRNVKRHKNHSPVVYQYFGKSRNRPSSQADDAPLNFILLGPNVDHWKAVGQILSSRGFNVMACERMIADNDEHFEAATKFEDAPELVLEILDALKWEKAVLVGCDDESLLAIETAMMLAPERVAGLILCGDLNKANQLSMEGEGVSILDSFLHRTLNCPFVIVWDGGALSVVSGSSAHEAIETTSSSFDSLNVDGRCVILGGGSAPHRTKPEYFSWILKRFVEEKIENYPHIGGKQRSTMTKVTEEDEFNGEEGTAMRTKRQNRGGILEKLNLPFGIDSLVSSEGRLLLGRAVAAAIFYSALMKIVIVQYGIIRIGWISIKNSVDSVDALRRKLFQAMGAFIPRLFKFSLKRTKELDEDDMSSSSIVDAESMIDPGEDMSLEKNNEERSGSKTDRGKGDDSGKGDEDEDNEDTLRMKPLFFLDNIFT
mmetsp:Transcript_25783/g.28944  ORF Transcript_25783/g.28944 Transcript_25783/m.28944 type:complete len:591 (-) Transcript_25783:132-1904(-)